MDTAERTALLHQYRSGADAVAAALDGVTDADLDRIPAEGGWTARQVVHHLADSETTAYLRLRRLLAEDAPVIAGYDENAFARMLHYDRPIGPSLAVLRAVRESSLQLLECLGDHEWGRAGTHTEDGPYSVEQWLRNYASHPYDHADQIRRARS